jgi:hypothetical protein
MSYITLIGPWFYITFLKAHVLREDKIGDVKGSFYEESSEYSINDLITVLEFCKEISISNLVRK